MARHLREVLGEQYGADLSTVSDSEMIDTIEYHVFPNMVLFPGLSLPMVYRFRPIGSDPERTLFEILFLRPNPADGQAPEPPEPCHVAERESYASAPGFDPAMDDLEELFLAHGDAFGAYARTFIASYVHVMGPVQALPSGMRLSKREVECLRWAAIGKTDLEMSMIMNRSRATVRFHIYNASVKLNAVNRSQTVFKAAQLGYISLSQ